MCRNFLQNTMQGWVHVHISDQITDHYAAELRTVKCWRKDVFHLFHHHTATNAYICYKLNPNKQEQNYALEFLVQLVEGLVGSYQEPRKKVGRPSLGPIKVALHGDHSGQETGKVCCLCIKALPRLHGDLYYNLV